MSSFTTKSSNSSQQKLFDRSKSQSVGSTIRYSGIQNQDIYKVKNSLQQMFRRRTLNRTSINYMERNKKLLRTANQTSYPFYGKKTDGFERMDSYQQKLINLKYQNIKYRPLQYDYTHLYFPARQRYVKTAKKSRTASIKSQQQLIPQYEDSIKLIQNQQYKSRLQYKYRRQSYSLSQQKQYNILKQNKQKSLLSKIRQKNSRNKMANKSKAQINIKKQDVNISPWDNQQKQF